MLCFPSRTPTAWIPGRGAQSVSEALKKKRDPVTHCALLLILSQLRTAATTESQCALTPCLWLAPSPPSQSPPFLLATVPPRTLPRQLSWCVGSPSMKPDILKGFFENSALCLHQYGVVLLQFCTTLAPKKQFLKPRDDGSGLPSQD